MSGFGPIIRLLNDNTQRKTLADTWDETYTLPENLFLACSADQLSLPWMRKIPTWWLWSADRWPFLRLGALLQRQLGRNCSALPLPLNFAEW